MVAGIDCHPTPIQQTGKDTNEIFIAERLQPESKVGIFAPLAKINLKTCKSANKSQKMDVNDKVVELKYNCNLFSRCAELKGKRDIDMKVVKSSLLPMNH